MHALPELPAVVVSQLAALHERLVAAEATAGAAYRARPSDETHAVAELAWHDRHALGALLRWVGLAPREAQPGPPAPPDELRLMVALTTPELDGLAELERDIAERMRWNASQAFNPMCESYTPGAVANEIGRATQLLDKLERMNLGLTRLKSLAVAGLPSEVP